MTEPRREHLELYVPEPAKAAESKRAGCLSLCVALVVVLWRVGW